MKKGPPTTYNIQNKRKSRASRKPSTTEPFSVKLKRMKGAKKVKLSIKTEDQYEPIEKQEQNDPKSHLIKLENQKQLIKLYQSNHTKIYEDLKKTYDYLKQDTQVESKKKEKSDVKKMLEKYSYSQPKTKKPKYGFEQFSHTAYVNKSCMKEFYDKYSKYNSHLVSLEFGGNRLSSLGVSKIFTTLNENKNLAYKLRTIDLSENHIGKSQIKSLIDFLQDPKCNLEDLNLFGNLLGNENIINLCDTIANYVEYKLNTINLGKNNITDSCIDVIVNLLHKCSGLRVFIINHNWLHNPSVTKIMKEIINHYELRILDLSWNCIGDDLTFTPKYESLVNKELNHPERLFNNFALNETLTTLKLNLRRNPLLPPLDSLGGGKKPQSQDKKKGKQDNSPVKAFVEPQKIKEKPKDPSPFAVELGEYFCKTSLSLIHLAKNQKIIM